MRRINISRALSYVAQGTCAPAHVYRRTRAHARVPPCSIVERVKVSGTAMIRNGRRWKTGARSSACHSTDRTDVLWEYSCESGPFGDETFNFVSVLGVDLAEEIGRRDEGSWFWEEWILFEGSFGVMDIFKENFGRRDVKVDILYQDLEIMDITKDSFANVEFNDPIVPSVFKNNPIRDIKAPNTKTRAHIQHVRARTKIFPSATPWYRFRTNNAKFSRKPKLKGSRRRGITSSEFLDPRAERKRRRRRLEPRRNLNSRPRRD